MRLRIDPDAFLFSLKRQAGLGFSPQKKVSAFAIASLSIFHFFDKFMILCKTSNNLIVMGV